MKFNTTCFCQDIEDNDSKERLYILPCDHAIHLTCARKMMNDLCPYCKKPMEINLPTLSDKMRICCSNTFDLRTVYALTLFYLILILIYCIITAVLYYEDIILIRLEYSLIFVSTNVLVATLLLICLKNCFGGRIQVI